ncbi:retrotransposon protein [Gossypium australe]|uniref:Retrotransposon protein n=1 Tax=Gossypium australe TaxID=47621 RepID=A0A5B6X1Z5_9ROSI|nr:retrotransposon protein [Gossypium australe]
MYWTELRENQIHGVDLVKEIEEKVKVICECLKAASDRQKSYSDLKQKEIEFQVGDKVFLKVSPWRKVLRFGRKGKLSLCFIGPYEITDRIRPVAYCLALPLELEKIHDVLHVSMLCRYRSDPSHVIVPSEIEIQPDVTYGEEPIKKNEELTTTEERLCDMSMNLSNDAVWENDENCDVEVPVGL